MPDGSTFQQPTQRPALRGYRCGECDAVTHLSDLNDDMVCAICAPPVERTWVPRRHLLEG
jgi:formylmethanofuran dehydrogenase subunit E